MSDTSKATPRPWQPVIKSAYQDGFREGMRLFAWWKDGVQQVGTTGTTLREAFTKHVPQNVATEDYVTQEALNSYNPERDRLAQQLAEDVRIFVDNYKNNNVPVSPASVSTVMYWDRLARQLLKLCEEEVVR